jgi:hypothetical protein
MMWVATRRVRSDLATPFIPPNVTHGIENKGSEVFVVRLRVDADVLDHGALRRSAAPSSRLSAQLMLRTAASPGGPQ